jgi:hypothetical protein
MKIYGINTQGKYWVQRVPDISVIPWTTADEGRLVYNEADDILYYGSNTEWVQSSEITSMFNVGQKVIFASQPLPTGWTLDTGANDRVPMITNNSNKLGRKGGTWTFTSTTGGSHDHYTPSGLGRGNSLDVRGTSEIYSTVATEEHRHVISDGGSHVHTFDGTWRPSHVELIVGVYGG